MIGPAASSASLLNEWLLIRTLQLAGELADPLPSPAPVQYAMALPSLQLLSFVVCRSSRSAASSPAYDSGVNDVVLIVRDCRAKRVWRMTQCYGRKAAASTEPAIAAAHSAQPRSPPLPFTHAADDRFYDAWLSNHQQYSANDTKSMASAAGTTETATADAPTTANPAVTSAVSSSTTASLTSASAAPAAVSSSSSGVSSVSSNLRTAIAAARAKSPAFASSVGSSAGAALRSNWKAAPQPFSLFDAWGETEAWLNNQQHSIEHQQYMRCIQEQMVACAQQPSLPAPAPMQRPSVNQPVADLGDGWSELHALLHHLGFFSSLLPPHTVLSASALLSYPLSPTAFPLPGVVSSPSLLLLHPSAALTESIDELDAISDARLHRVLLLTRRAQQNSEWDMLANLDPVDDAGEDKRGKDRASTAASSESSSTEAFSSLLSSLSDLSMHARQSEQLVWFIPTRLCPAMLSAAAESSSPHTADARRPAVWLSLLSVCAVRVVWCESEVEYVTPHRQRQRDRRGRSRARKATDGDGTADGEETSRRPASSSPHNGASEPAVLSASSQVLCPTALVYIIVSFHPPDAMYRVRVDCDWRLRNKQRRAGQQLSHGRSQSHSNAIVSAAATAAALHSSRWLPPPLVKANSLSNTQPQPPLSSVSTGTVLQSLFKRLGSRSARSTGQPADLLSVRSEGRRDGGGASASRTNSLSPARSSPSSSSLFATRRSPRRGHMSKHDSDSSDASHHHHQQQQQQQQQQQAERRRSERAELSRRHPILSQPFPPSDCFVGGDSLPARLSDAVLLSARRVQAWRECRSLARRRRQTEAHSRYNSNHRPPDEWSAAFEADENSQPLKGPSSTADAAVIERSRVLRDMVRDHGELVTPAAFFESVFGQQTAAAAAPH